MDRPETTADETAAGNGAADTVAAGAAEHEGDDVVAPPGLSWAKALVLAAALAFLGFSVGLVVARDRPPGADSVEVGFLQDMITHHDQALGVAMLTATHGDDPVVHSYALDVVSFQQYEIGLMTEMLDQWGYGRSDRSDEAMGWMDMPVPVEQMPGLLSDGQLDELAAARGAEIDRLFLERMAEHHRGGLHMAQAAQEQAGDDDVVDLAARIERNQASEINEYRQVAELRGFDVDIDPVPVPPA